MGARMWLMAGVMGILTTGCVADSQLTAPPGAPMPQAAVPKAQTRIVHFGKSVKGAPITAELFNEGPRPIFIIGGVHGDERGSVDVARELANLLREQPALTQGKPIAIMQVANPDAYAADTRTNSRGVDINRNFPAKNFQVARDGKRNGPHPLSEPESQALYAAMNTLQPRLFITIHSITRGRECNNYDGPAGKPAADLMSHYNGYRSIGNIGYPTPGSMGNYYGMDQGVPMVTLELPRDQSGADAWARNKEALLAIIREF